MIIIIIREKCSYLALKWEEGTFPTKFCLNSTSNAMKKKADPLTWRLVNKGVNGHWAITLVPKFYGNVFLFVDLTTLGTFIQFWFVASLS